MAEAKLPGPKAYRQLNEHAKRALQRVRLLPELLPRADRPALAKIEAAEQLVSLLDSKQKEYVVVARPRLGQDGPVRPRHTLLADDQEPGHPWSYRFRNPIAGQPQC